MELDNVPTDPIISPVHDRLTESTTSLLDPPPHSCLTTLHKFSSPTVYTVGVIQKSCKQTNRLILWWVGDEPDQIFITIIIILKKIVVFHDFSTVFVVNH